MKLLPHTILMTLMILYDFHDPCDQHSDKVFWPKRGKPSPKPRVYGGRKALFMLALLWELSAKCFVFAATRDPSRFSWKPDHISDDEFLETPSLFVGENIVESPPVKPERTEITTIAMTPLDFQFSMPHQFMTHTQGPPIGVNE